MDGPIPQSELLSTAAWDTGRLVDHFPVDVIDPESAAAAEARAERVSPWSLAAPADDRIAVAFNVAKIDSQGEDADPILQQARDVALLAVFDGMGGAGGTVYSTAEGPRTGAYLASRVARDVVERRMTDLMSAPGGLPEPSIAVTLHDDIEDALQARLVELQAPRSMLRSKLLRALPTTMALAAAHRDASEPDAWDCAVLWAGDSRIYLLQPGTGLAQLTSDDIRDRGDAMTNLRQDSVISNAMSADTPFQVNYRRVRLTTPFLIIAATDGCFGYVPSPMHFEGFLLSSLRTAPDALAWASRLQAEITATSGDDASMALLGIGGDYAHFQGAFAARTDELLARWVSPIDQITTAVDELERHLESLRRQQSELSAHLWATYRTDYQQYLRNSVDRGTL